QYASSIALAMGSGSTTRTLEYVVNQADYYTEEFGRHTRCFGYHVLFSIFGMQCLVYFLVLE
ncbi:hypothetical protein, partial [Enterobacter bugandensis]|uniref:hypothetical protein n=1 Tax=Enterobacter bugandensis TaxID=881260 RepID=UPI00195322C9